jgi:hypothetical protein
MFLTVALQTRARRDQLARTIEGLVAAAADPAGFEILLGVDSDDRAMDGFELPGIPLRVATLEPGLGAARRMNALTREARGRYMLFLNDDVESRTPRWDEALRAAIEAVPDGIQLIHVNDGVLGSQLCIYPCISRELLAVIGEPFQVPYRRWWADDHLHNIFYLLERLGFPRIRYLPDVLFENDFGRARRGEAVELPRYSAAFRADTEVDQRLFVESFDLRCGQALLLARHLAGSPDPATVAGWERTLAKLPCFNRQTIYVKWPRKWYRRLLWPLLRDQRRRASAP